MGLHEYHFVSRWQVIGAIEEVTDIMRCGRDLPRWWPTVYLDAQEVDPGDVDGVGATVELHSRGVLPYTIRWQAEAIETRHPNGFTMAISGDFVGIGVWAFEQDGDWVNATYDWRIEATKRLLRLGAPLLRPVFAYNHRWAMNKGEESLQLELTRRRVAASDHNKDPAHPASASPSTITLKVGG